MGFNARPSHVRGTLLIFVAIVGMTQGCGGGDKAVDLCGAGTYRDDEGTCSPWSVCEPGRRVATEGSLEVDRTCVDCEAGTFSSSANAPSCPRWTDCAAGEYVAAAGTPTSDRTCSPCSSETFSDTENSTSCVAWATCEAGTYVEADGSDIVDRLCAPCGEGTYTSGPNQSICVPIEGCPPGTVEVVPASTTSDATCEDCAAGQHCPGGSWAAVDCGDGDGTWDHDADPTTACVARTECEAGARVLYDGNATTDRQCEACLAGTFSYEVNAANCTAWTECAPEALEMAPGTMTSDRSCLDGWVHQFGTGGLDAARDVTLYPSGDVLVAGVANDSVGGQTHIGSSDIVLRRLSSAGAEVWTHQFGTVEYDVAESVSIDVDGNILVGGYTDGEFAGHTMTTDPPYSFVAKINLVGDVEWVDQFGHGEGSGDLNAVNGVVSDADGNVIAVGFTRGAFPGWTNAGSNDCFVRKLDTDGNVLWTHQFGSIGGDSALSVAVDSNGNIAVAGWVEAPLPGQTGWGPFVRMLSPSGSVLWTYQLGTEGSGSAVDVVFDVDESVLFTGFASASPSGASDSFVQRLSSEGELVWTYQFGDSLVSARAVSPGSSGNVVVAGTIYGSFAGLTGVGYDDVFIRDISTSGELDVTKQYGTSSIDNVWGMDVNASGDVVVAGRTYGTFPGQSSQGSSDAFVLYTSAP